MATQKKDLSRSDKRRLWQLLTAKDERSTPIGTMVLVVVLALLLIWPVTSKLMGD